MIGKTIRGYTIQRHIGDGGLADVYYAENKIGKAAAIKFLKKKFKRELYIYDRFIKGAKIMFTLNHPNIRKVIDIVVVDGIPAIIMEYLEGETLLDKIKNKRKIGDKYLKYYFDQCVLALRYTGRKKVIHRNIKPSNIFISKNNQVKIMNFQIVEIKEVIWRTKRLEALETIIYMSPEQIYDDPERVTPKTDVHSLAVTFYHALTGKAPYDHNIGSEFDIKSMIIYQSLDLSPLPSEWQKVLQPCLEKDPVKRIKIDNIPQWYIYHT